MIDLLRGFDLELDDVRAQRAYIRRAVGILLLCALALALLIAPLYGCAQLAQPVEGVCAFQNIGENEAGVQYMRYRCEPR